MNKPVISADVEIFGAVAIAFLLKEPEFAVTISKTERNNQRFVNK